LLCCRWYCCVNGGTVVTDDLLCLVQLLMVPSCRSVVFTLQRSIHQLTQLDMSSTFLMERLSTLRVPCFLEICSSSLARVSDVSLCMLFLSQQFYETWLKGCWGRWLGRLLFSLSWVDLVCDQEPCSVIVWRVIHSALLDLLMYATVEKWDVSSLFCKLNQEDHIAKIVPFCGWIHQVLRSGSIYC